MAKKKTTVEVPDTETEQPHTGEALVPVIAEKPTFIDLIKFTGKEESLKTIQDKRAEYDLITIDGVEDTATYKVVVANMSQMRDDRRAFESAAYGNVIDPLKDALKAYVADVEEIIGEFKAGEKAERDKKDFIDGEKKRLKIEAENEKVRVMQVRVNDINVLGAVFDGAVYTFPYSQVLMATAAEIKDFTAEKFTEFKAQVQEAYDAEQERINKKINDDALEADRIRLQNEKNQQDLDALILKRTKLRVKELRLLGYTHDPVDDEYVSDGSNPITVSLKLLDEAEDELWDQLIHEIEHYVAPEPVSEDPEPIPLSQIAAEVELAPPLPDYTEVANDAEAMAEENPTVITEFLEPEELEVTMKFELEIPYTDSEISPKMLMRVFPEQYKTQALAGVDKIANRGMFQALHWIIIPKQ